MYIYIYHMHIMYARMHTHAWPHYQIKSTRIKRQSPHLLTLMEDSSRGKWTLGVTFRVESHFPAQTS